MGGGGSTTTTNVPPPTESELKLQERQVMLSELQIDAIRQQSAFQTKLWDTLGPSFDAQKRLLEASIAQMPDPNDPVQKARVAREQEISDLIGGQELERARRGGGATDQEIKNIREAADAAIAAGGVDIDRETKDALTMLKDEFAPSAGLRATDSPIQYRADRALSEGLRLKGDLTTKIRAGEATARLSAPAGAGQVYESIGRGRDALASASERFTTDLRESAAANRLRLAGGYGEFINRAGSFGVNLVGAIGNPTGQALDSMQRGRFGSASTTTSSRKGFGDFIGPLVSGGASIGAAALISARDLKDILETLNGVDAEKMLDAVIALPMHRWRYKAGIGLESESIHVGPLAEDWQAKLGLGSSRTISMLDVLGVYGMAIQALAAKVAELEADAA